MDIIADVGADVVAPIGGTVRVITAVYAQDDPDFEGVEITNAEAEQQVKVLYVEPSVETGDLVEQGDLVGTAQDIAGAHEGGMQNHVHLSLEEGGESVDPEERLDD